MATLLLSNWKFHTQVLSVLPRGRFFVHFFPRKVIFRGKFRGICCGNDFSKLFPRKILIVPDIFWGKIFRGIFPGKNVQKIIPG
jgi:hypothetical protein